MTNTDHYRALKRMYLAAPINQIYHPKMMVTDGEASIEIPLSQKFHHPAGAVHGSVYFKMLDDSAFFAANSLETEFFALTTSFTTYLTRPVSSGAMKAIGKVVNQNKSQFISESIVFDDQERELGRGSGVFARSKFKLVDAPEYLLR